MDFLDELADTEFKKYNARQPRDESGRWSNGSGGISVGHALHVARREGLDDKHHASIKEGIESGKLDTREKVLAHIDELHRKSGDEKAAASDARTTKAKIDGIVSRYGIRGMAAETLHDEIPGNKNLEAHVGQVGAVALASALADGSGKVELHHVLEALHYTNHEKGFAGHIEKMKARKKDADEENRSQGLPPESDSEMARINIVASHYERARNSQVIAGPTPTPGYTPPSLGDAARTLGQLPQLPRPGALVHPRYRKSEDEEIMDDTLIAFGDGIKTVTETEDSYKFGAFLVVFDSPDISQFKDSFTKSTDFGFEDGDTRPILYNHGLDGTFGKSTIGKARLFLKDAGVWMEGEVKKRRDYLEKHVERVGEGLKATVRHGGIEAPMFGTSSGATGHAVVREAKGQGHEIKQWFIGEASITPTPAEPQTVCLSLKSLQEMEDGAEYKEWNESAHPREDNGRFGSGGGGSSRGSGHANSKVSKARLDAIAKQYGVSSNSVLHSVIDDAHDKGHINSIADLHNILSNSAQGGHDVADIEKHINEHGSGKGKYSNFLNKPAKDKKPAQGAPQPKLSGGAADHVLEAFGHGPNSVIAGVVQEARKKGYFKSPAELHKVLTELNKDDGSGGSEIDHLHTLINLHGDGPKHDGKFRSALIRGQKSWNETPLDERAVAIKTFLDSAPGDEMASGETNGLSLKTALTDYVRREAGRNGVFTS